MARVDADRNLLLGILAQQMDFVSRDTLFAAMNAWIIRKETPLGALLVERGDLAKSRCNLLEALVDEHVRAHAGDPARSLQALSSVGSVADDLGRLSDPDLRASLGHLPIPRAALPLTDDFATRAPGSLGEPTSWNGRFRVVRPHASGGLGIVSVALDDELDREVAFKEIRDQFADDDDRRTRFVLEAEITGKLEHPGIIPIYGLGHDPSGRPFYAMRFIRGDSLADAINRFHDPNGPHADPAKKSSQLRELLGRFLDVCDALAYAHSRGVLHRDLKPGNVMLGPFGETLVVDWGLALPLDRVPDGLETTQGPVKPTKADSSSLPREHGQAVGTPAYMPPEQAEGSIDQLGPRSDVYGLGAILYDLLTGKHPVEGASLEEVLRRVGRGEIKPPRQVRPEIPADLEAICLKALALKPEGRYATPRALAADIKAWLADDPVSARPEPLAERARRWAKRNRTAVTAAAASLLVGLVGLGAVATVQTRARGDLARKNAALDMQRGRAEAREAQAIAAVKQFGDVIANEPELKKTPALEGLRKRLLNEPLAFFRALREQLQSDRDTRPESLQRLAQAGFDLGSLTNEIGDKQDALIAYREALAIQRKLADANPSVTRYQSDLAGSHNSIGILLSETGQPAEALKAHELALAIRRKLADANPSVTRYQSDLAGSHNSIGILLSETGQPAEALKAHELALAIRRKLADANSSVTRYQNDLAGSHNNIGNLLNVIGQPAEALKAYESALAIRRKLADANPSVTRYQNDLAGSHNNIGNLLNVIGQPAEALKAHESALAIRRKLADANPSVTEFQNDLAGSHNNIGKLLSETGQPAEALKAYESALAIRRKLADANPSVTEFQNNLASSHNNIGNLLNEIGQPAGALKAYESALAIRRKLADANPSVTKFHNDLAGSHNNIGILLNVIGQPAEALKAHESALAIRRKLADANPSVTEFQSDLASSHNNIGILLSETGQPAEALKAHESALAIRRKLADANPSVTRYQNDLAGSHNNIGNLLSETGQPAGALKAYESALAIRRKLADANPSVTEYQNDLATSHNNIGDLLSETGQPAGALKAYESALAIRRKLADANPSVTEFQNDLASSHNNIGILLNVIGQPAEALKAHESALAIQQKLADANPSVTEFQNDLASSHNNIGILLSETGQPAEALKAYESALAIRRKLADANPSVTKFQSDLAGSHNNIGNLLNVIGQPAEALKAYESALAIQQKLADANPSVTEFQSDLASSHYNIGNLLSETGQPAEALKAYESALAIRRKLVREHPEFFDFASALGNTLNHIAIGDLKANRFEEARIRLRQAVDWQRKALASNPKNPIYRQFLANHLQNMIRAARGLGDSEGVAEAERALAELRESDPANIALDARLIAIHRGDQQPRDNAERLQLAQRAYDKALQADATKLWADALEADPKLAEDRRAQVRYNAACAAALGGCGRGKDNPAPDDAAKAKLRERARAWLQAELAAWTGLVESGPPEARPVVAPTLQHWKENGDLAGIREAKALEALPEAEREPWRALWAGVDTLLVKAQDKAPTAPVGKE